jgi:molybdopterin converting factor subunit 1
MPTVKVLLFARLSELAGTRETEIEVGEGLTVADAYDMLSRRYPKIAPLRASVMYAVNSDYAQPSQPLSPGDELALIPPVSGGSNAL